MATMKLYFHFILCLLNLFFGISDDEFYKKFHQTDYKVEFERESVSYYNKSYGELSHKIFKYNRTTFATNTTFFLHIDMDNDFEIIVQMYKFLSNEYRVFPVHFEYNFCKALKNNIAGLRDNSQKCGSLHCPMKKNIKYFVCNAIMDESKLPPFIPTGRFKLVLEGRYNNELVGIFETYLRIYLPIIPGKRVG